MTFIKEMSILKLFWAATAKDIYDKEFCVHLFDFEVDLLDYLIKL